MLPLEGKVAVVTGYDIIWAEHISREERALYAAGLAYGSGSMYRKGLGFADEGAHLAPLARKVHGNSFSSTRSTYLYQLRDPAGNHLKWGISSDLRGRYTKAYMRGKDIRLIDSGMRADMFAAERWLSERLPGELNREPWRGRYYGDFPFFGLGR